MTPSPLRIIFMGTPEFAVASLQTLVENQGTTHEVVGVITATDKPQGRGRKVAHSPIKEYALSQNIPVLQPPNLKKPEFLDELRSYQADLQVVVAFRMLPEAVWAMPRLGTFNLHASYLPQYRGAAPINWAIINGETETGVTTFMIRHEIDTGNILFQEKEPVHPNDTVGTLYERLMTKGGQLVLRTVQAIAQDNYQLTPQESVGELKEAPKLSREICRINWHQPAEAIRNFVRGLSPYPAAWTVLDTPTGNTMCKLLAVTHTGQQHDTLSPGEYVTDNKTYLHIQTQDTLLAVDDLQPAGKRRMTVDEFLRGNTL